MKLWLILLVFMVSNAQAYTGQSTNGLIDVNLFVPAYTSGNANQGTTDSNYFLTELTTGVWKSGNIEANVGVYFNTSDQITVFCGNSVCEGLETNANCPVDCPIVGDGGAGGAPTDVGAIPYPIPDANKLLQTGQVILGREKILNLVVILILFAVIFLITRNDSKPQIPTVVPV